MEVGVWPLSHTRLDFQNCCATLAKAYPQTFSNKCYSKLLTHQKSSHL